MGKFSDKLRAAAEKLESTEKPDFKSPVTLTPEAQEKVDATKAKTVASLNNIRTKVANAIAVDAD